MGDEGELVTGRYRLVEQAGQGAMGVVWRARDERLGRTVALKRLIHGAATGGPAFFHDLDRAMREARLAARLKHPHAITVYDVVEEAETVYLVMEYLPSRTLTDLLIERGPLPAAEVVGLGRQIASALAAAHADGILHRDVTPNNVLVTEDGTAKIADFGVSHAIGEGTMTGGGLVVGTPAYLAPEVAEGGETGLPSDVYSLGATLYTALEGAPPFGTGGNPIALLERITSDRLTPPRHTGPLADVLLRLLRRDPAERPAMADVERLLIECAARATLAPHRRSTTQRRLAKIGGVAACLIVAGVVATTAISDRPETAAAPIEPPRTTVTTEHTVHATTTAVPTVTAVPRPTPRTSAPAAAPPGTGCSARFEVTNAWPGGTQVLVKVHNDRPAGIASWTVSWTLPTGTTIRNVWDGVLDQRGSAVTVSNAKWNGTVGANAVTSFGLNANTTNGETGLTDLTCRL